MKTISVVSFELASLLGVSQQAASKSVAELVELGYLTSTVSADRRAREVRKYLVRLGVPEGKVEVISKGELEPKNEGHDEDAWTANRRAEFLEN